MAFHGSRAEQGESAREAWLWVQSLCRRCPHTDPHGVPSRGNSRDGLCASAPAGLRLPSCLWRPAGRPPGEPAAPCASTPASEPILHGAWGAEFHCESPSQDPDSQASSVSTAPELCPHPAGSCDRVRSQRTLQPRATTSRSGPCLARRVSPTLGPEGKHFAPESSFWKLLSPRETEPHPELPAW